MKELLGEPVAEAEAVYGWDNGGNETSRNRVWRYYYEESFWDARMP